MTGLKKVQREMILGGITTDGERRAGPIEPDTEYLGINHGLGLSNQSMGICY